MRLDKEKIRLDVNERLGIRGPVTDAEALGVVGRILLDAICDEFNAQFERALEQASTELLERAAVLLAERVAARGPGK